MNRAVVAALGAALVVAILRDVFEAIILPQTVRRTYRPARVFYIVTWNAWTPVARALPAGEPAGAGAGPVGGTPGRPPARSPTVYTPSPSFLGRTIARCSAACARRTASIMGSPRARNAVTSALSVHPSPSIGGSSLRGARSSQ